MELNKNSFVYEGIEVKKTGRIAKKSIKRLNRNATEFQLVEITPCDTINTWLKWVREDDLYTIQPMDS